MRDNCFYFLLATKQLVSGIQTHKLKFKTLWQWQICFVHAHSYFKLYNPCNDSFLSCKKLMARKKLSTLGMNTFPLFVSLTKFGFRAV